MKITVLGAGGNFGVDVADVLEERGHTVGRASRRTGVDAVAGKGLARAFDGADAVVDALHINTMGARKAVPFFARSRRTSRRRRRTSRAWVGSCACPSPAPRTRA